MPVKKYKTIDLNADGNRCGESHPIAKLTWKEVDAIRDAREDYGLTYRELAERYGVTLWCIRDVCNYRSWCNRPVYEKRIKI